MWYHEAHDYHILMLKYSLKDLSEQLIDRDRVAWFNRYAEYLSPAAKNAVIDRRDRDLFLNVERAMTGKKKFVLLNFWHLDGVE